MKLPMRGQNLYCETTDVIPPMPQRKCVPYRADAHTTVYIDAKLNKKERQQRFERFCIKHQLGEWRKFAAEQKRGAV